jgi:hypothetical protein
VRSDGNDAERRKAARRSPDQISGGVDAHREPSVSKLLGKPTATFQEQRAERSARIGVLGVRDFRERHYIDPQAISVDREILWRQASLR